MHLNPYTASSDIDSNGNTAGPNAVRGLSVRGTIVLTLFGFVMIGAFSFVTYVILASGYGFDLPGGYRPPNSERFRRTLGITAWITTGLAFLSFSYAACYGRGRSRIPAGAFSLIVFVLISWAVIAEIFHY
ncbi:hypothetical protein Poly24_08600 [Rosistilla carotiformis]|uniref:Uncharacterized protein n=1 Tax=Rosistilla carotiformis TaxID=2528017 RepID=A0A518JNT0_9BACT|nr:hypothetical protein [Rosistilla carotiformis]QDV67168.1 hypothetical protein Poly24_08600 [Rosistilla carotiformis]